MTDFWLQVLSGVLSALLTAVPVALMSTWAQRRIRVPHTIDEREVAVTRSTLPTAAVIERRTTKSSTSSGNDSGIAILIGASALVAAWFFAQHPVAVGASLIGLAVGCVAGLVLIWTRSISGLHRVPQRATLPTVQVGIVVAELALTIALLARVQLHGATVWTMGALLRTGNAEPTQPFLQTVVSQYGALIDRFGIPSMVVLVYAVLIAVACVISVLVAAVTLFDWSCYLAHIDGTAGPFASRRAARYLQHGWGARLTPLLIPAILLALFVLMPGFVDQPTSVFPSLQPTHAPEAITTG
ncbi:hypothetical protein [Curtobacterium sp. MCBA15_013]|uniref:hypothetical protein n=1 Tax=Curtobacterium sp. MCBA15_013 TaxID=1898739 RepID=UPI0008DCD164|nr:hypothetical protein [Curtobacterium sp. MCBA15_013]OII18438.1 hypothetical protein BIV01_02525 [Curtobacterium sp. MCBA15_013]